MLLLGHPTFPDYGTYCSVFSTQTQYDMDRAMDTCRNRQQTKDMNPALGKTIKDLVKDLAHPYVIRCHNFLYMLW